MEASTLFFEKDVLVAIWELVWQQAPVFRLRPWFYLLEDRDMIRLSSVLDIWCGYEEGSHGWLLDAAALYGGAPMFQICTRPPFGHDVVLLCMEEMPETFNVCPNNIILDEKVLLRSAAQKTLLQCGFMRNIERPFWNRAKVIADRNHRLFEAGMSMKTIVTSARPFLERKNGRWGRQLPGARRKKI